MTSVPETLIIAPAQIHTCQSPSMWLLGNC